MDSQITYRKCQTKQQRSGSAKFVGTNSSNTSVHSQIAHNYMFTLFKIHNGLILRVGLSIARNFAPCSELFCGFRLVIPVILELPTSPTF
jgi:hypothetical protein